MRPHQVIKEKVEKKHKTSLAGINHNVDELLVGVVTQLKLRKTAASEKTNKDKVSNETLLCSLFLFNWSIFRSWTFLTVCWASKWTNINLAAISTFYERALLWIVMYFYQFKNFPLDRSFTIKQCYKSIPLFRIKQWWIFSNLNSSQTKQYFFLLLFSHGHWIPSAARGSCLKGNYNYFHLCGFHFLDRTHQSWLVCHEFCCPWSVGCLETIKNSEECQNLKN